MKDSPSHRDFVVPGLKSIPRSGIRDFFDIVSTRRDVISLGIGEPDFVTPWHIREASVYSLNRGATSYTSNLGLLDLRRELSKYVSASFGADYNPENEILVTVGVSEAVDLAIRAVVDPGDEVLYHEPSYVSYAPVVLFAHAKPVPVVTGRNDNFRLTRRMLEEKVTAKTRALILNFPTNPTGAVLSRREIEDIAEFAVKHDLVVLTDEIYSELTYDAERVSIASIPGMKQRTIFLHGFSKAWAMTGFRVGYACAQPDIIEAMMKIHQYTMMCAPILSQKAAVEALRNGNNDVAAMREEYRTRRNFIVSSLNEMGIPCHLPDGAFYAFPWIGGFGIPSKEFALRMLDEINVACVPGTAFGPSGEGFLRCSYAADLELIKEAMSRMSGFVKKLKPA